jgi:hypothetical protein
LDGPGASTHRIFAESLRQILTALCWIISQNYLWCTTQREYFFQVFDMMTPNQAT